MQTLNRFRQYLFISVLGGLLLSSLLSSCGSDINTAGIGGTGITQGEITAFGSIFVNGVEFDTDSSTFEVDGNVGATQANLAIGMVVIVRGDVDSNGLTGTANSVEYDDEIQGPVVAVSATTNGQKTLEVFNKVVTIDESTTKFEDTSFSGIAISDIVEISGYRTSSTEVRATFVKHIGTYPANSEIEIKGTIENLSLSSKSFDLSGIQINYDESTEIDVPSGTLSNDLYVEVEGDLQSLTTVFAKEIELEDDDFEDGSEVSLQGVISNYDGASYTFIVSGQSVDASGASFSPSNATLGNGVNIEVEGEIINGVLIADEVELREGEVEIQAFISSIDTSNNRFTYSFPNTSGSIEINVDNQTSFEDETTSIENFNIDDLADNDFIKIEGIDNGSEIVANQVKRLNAEDTEVEGPVDSFNATGKTITIYGVEFSVASASIPSPQPQPGDIVEITDNDPADGSFDDIELDD